LVTGYAPSVVVGANVSLGAGNASLTLTAYAPTVNTTASVGVTPSTAFLAATGYAPTATASANVWLTPSFATLSITAYNSVVSYSSGYESLYPDAIISQTGSTGAYTDIDDDPDNPDGLWLTTTAQNGTLRVSFPTPSANLRTGAGLQQFRVYVRKVDNTDTPASGGGDPTLKISVRETGGGSDLAAGSTGIISSTTGFVATFDWNASVLASIDGSGVECYCVTTGDGVGETDERRVQIGAVEWVAATVTTTTVQPYGGLLTLTGYAPTVDATTNATVTPSAAYLTAIGYAPSTAVSDNVLLATSAATLTATGYAPNVTATTNVAVIPFTASLVVTGYAPSITANDSVAIVPYTATLTFVGYAPTTLLGGNAYAYPTTATLSLVSGVDYRPSVSFKYIATPLSADLFLVGVEPFIVNSGVVDSISPRDERIANERVVVQSANHLVAARTANRRGTT
jgi:hypothetical protein